LAKQHLGQRAALSLRRLDIDQRNQRSFGLHSNGNVGEPHMNDLVVIAFPTEVKATAAPRRHDH
jgi:hypothetical protein